MTFTAEHYVEQSALLLDTVRQKAPLVHNITNFVVMNLTANALLAAGASPIMAHAPEEMNEMASIAGAVVLNIGTLTNPWVDSMISAAKVARDLDTPVVLDPVGVGASELRTNSAWKIIKEAGITILRGNASEVLALRQVDAVTKGVDSVHGVNEAEEVAVELAKELGIVVAITGAEDLVTDGERIVAIANGHPMLTKVTGTGCTCSAITGAFAACSPDPFLGTVAALSYFGMAGEFAYNKSQSPGSYAVAMMDELYEIRPEEIRKNAKISVKA